MAKTTKTAMGAETVITAKPRAGENDTITVETTITGRIIMAEIRGTEIKGETHKQKQSQQVQIVD